MNNDTNNECIICFDSIEIDKHNIKLFKDCQHTNYHKVCINNWINSCIDKNIPPTCPICSKELDIIVKTQPIIEHVRINNINDFQTYNDNLNEFQTYFKYTQQCCCICTLSIFASIIIIGFLAQEY